MINLENTNITYIGLQQHTNRGPLTGQDLIRSAVSQGRNDLGVGSTSATFAGSFEMFLANNPQTSEASKLLLKEKERNRETAYGGKPSNDPKGDSG